MSIESHRDLVVWQKGMKLAAEGHSRGTRKDYAHFVSIARGSLAETETFVLLANSVGLLKSEDIDPVVELSREISKMLTALLGRLRAAPI